VRLSLLAIDSGGEPFDESCSLVWTRLNEHYQNHTGHAGPWPHACLAVTIELRAETDVSHDYAVRDVAPFSIICSSRFYRCAAPGSATAVDARPLAGSLPITTPHGGVFASAIAGQMVVAGQVIAEVVDPLSGGTVLRTHIDGLL
jgi:hypothetical protein